MARIREKLRHARVPAAPRPIANEAARIEVAEPPVIEAQTEVIERMPYIEVGAKHYFEASPEVLATIPAPSAPRVEQPAALPRPHSVILRSLPAVVEAPQPRLAPELVSYHTPGHAASARYADLLAGLLEAGRLKAGKVCRTLLLTAGHSGIGTTTVLLNLAITAARQDQCVVVVDANLRHPAIADRLGLPRSPGLTEVLAGEIPLADALQLTAQPKLVMLASGAPTALLADEPSVRGLVHQLAQSYELVLIDAPRIDHAGSAANRTWESRAMSLLASACQAMYLVVPAADVDSAVTTDLTKGMIARALPLAGCIVAG